MGIRRGSTTADYLVGTGDSDTLSGLAGNDTLVGQAGADYLDGGAGTDTVVYTFATAVTGIAFTFGRAVTDEFQDIDTLASIERVRVSGSRYDDSLIGGSGADQISGYLGVDSLVGGRGDDTLDGGPGGDWLEGGDGYDTAVYAFSGSEGAVFAVLNGGTNVIDEGGDADTLNAIEAFFVTGTAHADTLSGGDGNDLFRGGGGADSLDGGDGIDTVLYNFSAGGAGVTVRAGATVTDEGGEIDALSHIERFHLIGTSFSDDTLVGGTGDDSLSGLGGADILTGGAGADTFVFATAPGTHDDRITDFSRRQGDRIDLSAIDANSNQAGNQTFRFVGSAALNTSPGRLRVESQDGGFEVTGDTNGDGTADLNFMVSIQIVGAAGSQTALEASDFLL